MRPLATELQGVRRSRGANGFDPTTTSPQGVSHRPSHVPAPPTRPPRLGLCSRQGLVISGHALDDGPRRPEPDEPEASAAPQELGVTEGVAEPEGVAVVDGVVVAVAEAVALGVAAGGVISE